MILGLQLIAIVFSLIMLYFAFLHYQRKEITNLEMITWWIIWVATIIIVIFPDLLRGFATTFFITRVFDFMVIGGFILVISLTYTAYIKIKILERKIEKFIRKEALKETPRAKKKK